MEKISQDFLKDNLAKHPYDSNPDYFAEITFLYFSSDKKTVAFYWEAPEGWFEYECAADEVLYIIEGELDLIIDNEILNIRKGELYSAKNGDKLKFKIRKFVKSFGFIYPADKVETSTTFDISLDPQCKNKIIIQNNNVGSILEVALWLGFKNASMLAKEQLEQVYDRLVEFKKNIRYLSPNFGNVQNAFESSEALMCFNGWDAVALWCQAGGVKNIKTAIPDEGTDTFIDNYCITKGAKNQKAAYAFINYLPQPEVHAEYCAILSSGVVNKKSVEFLPEINKNAYTYNDFEEYFAKVHLCPINPLESDEFTTTADWAAMWERFKLAE